jgi:hypothetical protein
MIGVGRGKTIDGVGGKRSGRGDVGGKWRQRRRLVLLVVVVVFVERKKILEGITDSMDRHLGEETHVLYILLPLLRRDIYPIMNSK